jgi:hypothetical protein
MNARNAENPKVNVVIALKPTDQSMGANAVEHNSYPEPE